MQELEENFTIIMKFLRALAVALLLLNFRAAFGAAKPKFRHEQEWGKWKLSNDRNYTSELEELERHLIWLSNKVYIDQHNANAHIFGFTLAMNHLGDLVRLNNPCTIIFNTTLIISCLSIV